MEAATSGASGANPWVMIDSRFRTLEERVQIHDTTLGLEQKDIAELRQEVGLMIDQFRAFRTALYMAAGTIMAAAFLVIFLGQHT